MSKDRIPEGTRHVVFRVVLLDDIATVEYSYDDALGWFWVDTIKRKYEIQGNDYDVTLCVPPTSDEITRPEAIEIARRWLSGEYITVDFATIK